MPWCRASQGWKKVIGTIPNTSLKLHEQELEKGGEIPAKSTEDYRTTPVNSLNEINVEPCKDNHMIDQGWFVDLQKTSQLLLQVCGWTIYTGGSDHVVAFAI